MYCLRECVEREKGGFIFSAGKCSSKSSSNLVYLSFRIINILIVDSSAQDYKTWLFLSPCIQQPIPVKHFDILVRIQSYQDADPIPLIICEFISRCVYSSRCHLSCLQSSFNSLLNICCSHPQHYCHLLLSA